MFKFYLDNVLVNDPTNWKDFNEVVEYDIQDNTLLYSYPTEIKWSGGDAYDILLSGYELNNDSYAEIKVQQDICGNYKTIFIGNIFYSTLLLNRGRCTVSAIITDNNFKSFLNNNKNIEVYIQEDGVGVKSKNGVSLTNQINVNVTTVKLFNPKTGVVTNATSAQGFYVYDCFKYLTAYLSDLNVDFRSNYLDPTLPIVTDADKVKQLIVISGGNLWAGNRDNNFFYGLVPKLSLAQLLKEVNRFYRIGYYIEYDFTGRPTFVIEDLDTLRNSTTILTYNTIKDVEEERLTDAYYSAVNVGGENFAFEDDTTNMAFDDAEKYSFKPEPYYIAEQENIDKVLDLTGQFIVDTNIIQQLTYMAFGVTDQYVEIYRNNHFFLEVDVANAANINSPNAYKVQNNVVNNASWWHYNDSLININIINRINNLGAIYFTSSNDVYNLINNSPKKFLKNFKFTKAIPSEDYQTIKLNLIKKIEFNIDNNGNMSSGWIKRIDRKFYTGQAQIELRAE